MRYTSWKWIALAIGALATGPVTARAQTQQGKAVVAAGYAGSASCIECHHKEVQQFVDSPKGRLLLKHPRDQHEAQGCESCHGPGKQHAESGGEERGALVSFDRKHPSTAAARNAVCLGCHEKTARTMWQGSTHEARDVACVDCHAVMHSDAERGALQKPSVIQTCGTCHPQQRNAALRFTHMPLGEKKLECTSCHNPHGSANPKLLLASSVNETCYSCHAEKRGPMLFEHPPVVENCATCHDPHGTSHEQMLKASRPRICQQCHGGASGHPGSPKDPSIRTLSTGAVVSDLQYVMNRECNNCHTQIHGSNSPSGKFFTR